MSSKETYRRVALAAALALAAAQAGAQSAHTTAEIPPTEAPIVVEESAPPGSSREVATGAVIGVVLGIFLLSMAVSGLD